MRTSSRLCTYRRRRAACPQGPTYCTYWVRVPASAVPYAPPTLAPQILCVNPVDVVRTRLYNAPPGRYSGGADAAAQLVTLEGPLAFYKGALTHYLRLGPHMVLVFGILEQLKLLMR